LSGRGLCGELITRPEESYRLCCVVVCDLETSRIGAPYIYDISRLRVKDISYWVRAYPCRYHSSNDSYTSLSLPYYCSYQKDKRAKPRHFQVKLCSFWSTGQKGTLTFILECHHSDGRGQDSIPGQSLYDLWWSQWHCASFIFEYFPFPCVSIIPPMLHTLTRAHAHTQDTHTHTDARTLYLQGCF